MKLLVVEDDPTLADFIAKGLRQAGFVVDLCVDGKDALFRVMTESYDLMIMDRMLPQVDGLTIIRTLRASANQTPVLILSALDDVDQRVEGLAAGADDYLTKPFAFKELLARVQALLRRQAPVNGLGTQLQVADVLLDLAKQKVWVDGLAVAMQPREIRLLEYLMRHEGQLISRTMLLENVWEYHFDPQTNIVDVHISRLRQKLDKNRSGSLIQTVRGAGYVLAAHT
ncbi:MAG: response regulator transcription factor [Reinekea forsetii]|uniref:Two-component system response regulator n=1 Tax=Reinekea forsetii TaxID=1336806 RepID=A0A2K8KPC9_9GAMM|nr:response regulator transcription factor [Reinekea forsetii]ATX75909.1 two-component system response regulator [Reinekea forsetii]MDO7640659.1 response regulator transcription factor [Reinekea forsetii]MDO7644776.1 response regulator transcription factor [Reinekea forsetii]MDO7673188.1 response regulator transcription factor [Reinekea forsetii]